MAEDHPYRPKIWTGEEDDGTYADTVNVEWPPTSDWHGTVQMSGAATGETRVGIEHPADGTWSPEITNDDPSLPPAEPIQQVEATGAARRLADDHGINIADLHPGSGAEGRITKDDVDRAIEARNG